MNAAGLLIAAWALVVGVATGPAPAHADKNPVYTSTFSSVAIRGTDPVAYFRVGQPVEGRAEFSVEWNGATWHFANAENRDAFRDDPEAFAPQYGGYCAWAVANGYTASTVPEAWHIHGGRLYLNYSLGVRTQWREDVAGNIERGDGNWPGVLDR